MINCYEAHKTTLSVLEAVREKVLYLPQLETIDTRSIGWEDLIDYLEAEVKAATIRVAQAKSRPPFPRRTSPKE